MDKHIKEQLFSIAQAKLKLIILFKKIVKIMKHTKDKTVSEHNEVSHFSSIPRIAMQFMECLYSGRLMLHSFLLILFKSTM